jgi:hypothetical protein
MMYLPGRKGSTAARRERHPKMARKRAFRKAKSANVFGQARKRSKMFRAGLYVRVSAYDQLAVVTTSNRTSVKDRIAFE